MHKIHRRFPFFLNVRIMSADTVVLSSASDCKRLYYTDAVMVHVISADVYRTDQHCCTYLVSLLSTHPSRDIDVARVSVCVHHGCHNTKLKFLTENPHKDLRL